MDYTPDTLPDWIKVGEKVAVLYHHWTTTVRYIGTVESIGKRDIKVRHPNNRDLLSVFRVKNLREQGRSYGGEYLENPKGPEVRRIQAEQRMRDRIYEARSEIDSWVAEGRDQKSPESTHRLIAALVECLPTGNLKRDLKAVLSDHKPKTTVDVQ